MSDKFIIVTGFGPFSGHEQVNASWEAVKLLPNTITVKSLTLPITKLEIPVIYEGVDNAVDNIWNKNPSLVVHCGVGNTDNCIALEKYSYSRIFCRPDWSNKVLKCNKAVLKNNETCEVLKTNFKLDDYVKDINGDNNKYVRVSDNPGEYLCCYIYLKSLDIDPDRSLFIHVPPIDQNLSIFETKDAIFKVIKKCVEQLLDENKL